MSREPTDSLHSQPSLMGPDGAFRKSLKRPRIEADVAERETFDDFSLAAAEGGPGSVLPVRDGKFYMEDGSCVIRVEDTLFNLSFICKSYVRHVIECALLHRSIDQYCHATPRLSRPCLLSPKVAMLLKARTTIIRSTLEEIALISSGTSFGQCTLCACS